MNNSQHALLSLIRESQFRIPTDKSLISDMDEVYLEAFHQSVLGLVAPIVISLRYDDEKWKQAHLRQISSYIRYCYVEEDMGQTLDKEQIPFVILKGNAASINYNDPSRRTMGDIDIIVKREDFDKAKEVLVNNGYELNFEDKRYPRHIGLKKNGIEIELHRFFSHEDLDIDEYVMSGIETRVTGKIEDHSFPMLPKLANGLVLLLHMKHHLQSGLGLRQVIDWMMYVNNNLDDEFWNSEFGIIAHEKGLDILAMVTTKMCQKYLGLPEEITWCKNADDRLCEQLMDSLLEAGNFGRKQGKGSSVEFVSASIKREGLIHWLQYAGEYNWKAYHKHHWLKPLCWIYQIFRYAGQGIKSGRNKKQLSADMDRGKQRYELLKKLGIE